ncbi:MAG TPA: mycofactocin precursor MftA [Ktedonobacteraceae bacterium]|nr:mycofactocin precursor MftA [Ktedonobacteraceae bacterium]
MADTIASAPHTPDTEQAPSDLLPGTQEQAAPPIAIETVLAANPADSTDPNAPKAPVSPPAPAVQPATEEEELDELIIEDFTIDGICGVY